MAESSKAFVRAFSGYSLGVLLSRVSGMCRDISLAFFFGTSSELALFMVAYRFANLMRRMLAESPLSSSFIPVFESLRARHPKEGSYFFRDLFFSLALIVVGIVACSMGGLFWSEKLFMHSHDAVEVNRLTQVMIPSLVFISLYGLCSAFLQCKKMFFLPAVAPIAFNMVWIVAAWWAWRHTSFKPMDVLAYGVILAFAMQWVMLMPKVIQNLTADISWKECLRPKLFHPSLKAMVKPFVLGTLGIGATQINIALDSIFARMADPQGPALLWYAIRIEQVPVALFGVAVASAILPALTRSIKQGQERRELLEQGIKQTFALMTFSMFGLLALGQLTISMIFGHGQFQEASVASTSTCLYGYAVGLIPHGMTLLLASIHYAHRDFKRPMRGAALSVLLNIACNVLMVFVFHFGAASIAFSTSLTSMFNGWYLYRSFKRYEEESLAPWSFYIKTLGCGLVSFVCVWVLMTSLRGWINSQLLTWVVLVFMYTASYCFLEKSLGCQQLIRLIRLCMR